MPFGPSSTGTPRALPVGLPRGGGSSKAGASLSDILEELRSQTELLDEIANSADILASKRGGLGAGRPDSAFADVFGRAVGGHIRAGFLSIERRAMFGTVGGGNGVLGKSLDLLGDTIGTMLLPVTTSLAAGFVMLGDYIWSEIVPNLDEWVDGVISAAEAVVDFASAIGNVIGEMADFTAELFDELDAIGESIGEHVGRAIYGDDAFGAPRSDFGDWLGEAFAAPAMGREAAGGEERGGRTKRDRSKFTDALSEVLTEITVSMGAKGGYTSIAGAARQAQTAAFMTPFQQKTLDRMGQMMDALKRVATNTDKMAVGSGAGGLTFGEGNF